jgi:hypothetical protein
MNDPLLQAWRAAISPYQRVSWRVVAVMCSQCQHEIAAYETGDGRRIGLGCVRRALAQAGVQIGWAIK